MIDVKLQLFQLAALHKLIEKNEMAFENASEIIVTKDSGEVYTM